MTPLNTLAPVQLQQDNLENEYLGVQSLLIGPFESNTIVGIPEEDPEENAIGPCKFNHAYYWVYKLYGNIERNEEEEEDYMNLKAIREVKSCLSDDKIISGRDNSIFDTITIPESLLHKKDENID